MYTYIPGLVFSLLCASIKLLSIIFKVLIIFSRLFILNCTTSTIAIMLLVYFARYFINLILDVSDNNLDKAFIITSII